VAERRGNETTMLLTGGSGYLGRAVVARAPEALHATCFQSEGVGLPADRTHRIDLRDGSAVRALVERLGPRVLIHTAASDRTEESAASIVPAARHLAGIAGELGIRLLHVSTDLVHDGESAPYADDAPARPLSAYGERKARAEEIVRELAPDHVVVRTSLLFGFEPLDRQTRWIAEGVREGKEVRLFTDELRCPIPAGTLAAALLELARLPFRGTLNVASPGPIDRFRFGLALLEALGIDPGDRVRRSTIAESGLVRPRDLTLDVRRAREILTTELVPAAVAMRRLTRPDRVGAPPPGPRERTP